MFIKFEGCFLRGQEVQIQTVALLTLEFNWYIANTLGNPLFSEIVVIGQSSSKCPSSSSCTATFMKFVWLFLFF